MNGRAFAGPTIGGLTLRLLARHPQRVAFIDETGRQTSYSLPPTSSVDTSTSWPTRVCDVARSLRCSAATAWRDGARHRSPMPRDDGDVVASSGSHADQRLQLELCEVDALIVDEVNHGTRGGQLGATFTLGATDYAIDLASAAYVSALPHRGMTPTSTTLR